MPNKIKILVISTVLLISAFMLVTISVKWQQSKDNTRKIEQLPEFSFYDVRNDEQFNTSYLDGNSAIVIIYYNSECEHCLNELKEISYQRSMLQEIQVLFISYEDKETIKNIAQKFALFSEPNIFFLQDEKLTFDKIFGVSKLPATFIYNQDRFLVKRTHELINPPLILNLLTHK